jgi:hypothetical protein
VRHTIQSLGTPFHLTLTYDLWTLVGFETKLPDGARGDRLAPLIETVDLHAERWSDPPGSLWVTYLRPANAFAV